MNWAEYERELIEVWMKFACDFDALDWAGFYR